MENRENGNEGGGGGRGEEPSERKTKIIAKFFSKSKTTLRDSLASLHSDSSVDAVRIVEAIRHDILFLANIESSLVVGCEIMALFIDCFLIVRKKLTPSASSSSSSSITVKQSSNYNSTLGQGLGSASGSRSGSGDFNQLVQIEEAVLLSMKLLMLYKGYSSDEAFTLIQLHLCLRGLYLKELYRRKTQFNSSLLNQQNANPYLVCCNCRANVLLYKIYELITR